MVLYRWLTFWPLSITFLMEIIAQKILERESDINWIGYGIAIPHSLDKHRSSLHGCGTFKGRDRIRRYR